LQALREIQNSPYAKKVFEQIKTQEATKQQELKVKEAEYKAAAEKAAIVRSIIFIRNARAIQRN
jgi:ATPase family AAA domain-containing protein 3A/B